MNFSSVKAVSGAYPLRGKLITSDRPFEGGVLAEGGPYHVRGHLPAYLDRLRETGRGNWADALVERFPADAGA